MEFISPILGFTTETSVGKASIEMHRTGTMDLYILRHDGQRVGPPAARVRTPSELGQVFAEFGVPPGEAAEIAQKAWTIYEIDSFLRPGDTVEKSRISNVLGTLILAAVAVLLAGGFWTLVGWVF